MIATRTDTLPRRRLGRTGRLVSEVGLGGAGLHGVYGRTTDDNTAIATVRRALELGITFFDTSAGYGESERRLGMALDGVDRGSIFLATKTGTGSRPKDYTADGTFASIERSLSRLRTERLDLVHIHDPSPAEFERALAPDGALEALLKLKDEGVIGAIGLGVRGHDLLLRAIRHGAFDAILTYGDFNLVRRTAAETLFPEAAARDVGVILGSPLLMGWLTDRPWEALARERSPREMESESARAARRIRDWADARGLSTVSLALQFCLHEPRLSTLVVGASTPEEVEENVRAATTPLAQEDLIEAGGLAASLGSPVT